MFLILLNITVPDCMGLTYEPISKEWTLRNGTHPENSLLEEISMLLDCLNGKQGKILSNFTCIFKNGVLFDVYIIAHCLAIKYLIFRYVCTRY